MNTMLADFQRREIKYRDYTLNLAAGVPQTLDVAGDYWQLIKSPAGEVTIEMDERVKIARQAPSGGPGNYSRVTVTSALGQTIVIALGYTNGLVPYQGAIVVGGSIEVTNAVPGNNQGLTDLNIGAGATGTFVQNLQRDCIVITLDDNAPDYVRVCSGAATEGARLYPGGSVTLRCKAAVTIRNPNGVAVAVSAFETFLLIP